MPCGCFGKKNAKITKNVDQGDDGRKVVTAPPAEPNGRNEEDPAKTAKRRDVVASYYGDQCALLGYHPTGSRPPSSGVDSPSTAATRTPSTAPLAHSPSPPLSSGSPSSDRFGASCRAELAQKRREFFKDFVPPQQRMVYHKSYDSSTTLPTVSRARHFGEVRTPVRPVSQPPPGGSPPLLASPPPGPHLLRPTPYTSKIDGALSQEPTSGFSSPTFLRELKDASEEMSRRWGMALDEDPDRLSEFGKPFLVPIDPFSTEEFQQQEHACLSDSSTSPATSPYDGFPSEDPFEKAPVIISSPGHSSNALEDGKVEIIASGSTSSSHASSDVQMSAESPREGQESSVVIFDSLPDALDHEPDLFDTEIAPVAIEDVRPHDIYLYEEIETEGVSPGTPEHPSPTALDTQFPDIRDDTNIYIDNSDNVPIDDQSSFPRPSQLPPVFEDPNHEYEESMASQEHMEWSGNLEAQGDFKEPLITPEPILTKHRQPPYSNIELDETEYEKPSKISKISSDETPDGLLLDESRFVIRQSSSDVD